VPAPAAVDRYVLPAERSAANPPHAAVAVERQDRQVKGRTRYIDLARQHASASVAVWRSGFQGAPKIPVYFQALYLSQFLSKN